MKSKKLIIALLSIGMLSASCAVVRPGEVGVKQRYGKLKGNPKDQGIVLLNPFTTKLLKIPTRTVNREVTLNLPSKEGLNVAAKISILYHVQKEKAMDIVNEVGGNFEKVLILSTFRSASADVCARFFAKDMHSGKRAEIETEIKDQMSKLLEGRGFVIESVLLKSITLPSGLYAAIEAKLQAEQQAQQMEFILQRERKEAERKRIEAEGIRDAQRIIKEGITNENIEWKSLEVLRELSSSPNAKLIITNGKTPVLINGDD
ncbi:MAG: spfh domain, band 7 family protein [Crocinitomicaceae bacterium]|nr:spfh domain, band 7 family protein [Crocinitomicaceae bacterium]